MWRRGPRPARCAGRLRPKDLAVPGKQENVSPGRQARGTPASAVEGGQAEAEQALGVDDHVYFRDLAAGDGEAHDRDRLTAQRYDHTRSPCSASPTESASSASSSGLVPSARLTTGSGTCTPMSSSRRVWRE